MAHPHFLFFVVPYQKWLLTCLLLFPILSFAQLNDTLQLEPVEITAVRSAESIHDVPAAINVLQKQEIQELNATISIDEALRKIPGLSVNNRYNFSQGERINIRGLGSRAQYGIRSIKVLLDGIPMTFPDGTTQLNNLDLSSIGKIEILRGPAAAMYGNAAGGVIAFYTEKPPLNTSLLTPGIVIGSDGLFKSNLKFSKGSKNIQLLINGSTTNYNGFRDFSSARFYNLNSNLKWYPNKTTSISFIANFMHAPYMYNPGSIDKKALNTDPITVRPIIKRQIASKAVTQTQGGFHIKKGIGTGEIQSNIYLIKRDLFNPIFGRIIDLKRWSIGSRNSYSNRFKIKETEIFYTAGLEYEFQNDNRSEFDNLGVSDEIVASTSLNKLIHKAKKGNILIDQREKIQAFGSYALVNISPNSDLKFTSGIRYDYQTFIISNNLSGPEYKSGKVNFDQFSPSIGLVHNFIDNWNYYLNFSTAFQTPTANEFSNDPSGSGFNKELKPERVRSFESGIRKSGAKLNMEVALFLFNIQNQLIPYQINASSDETYYRNAGKARNSGVEFWLQYEPFSDLSFYFNYTYMNYRFTDYVVETSPGAVQLKNFKVPGVPDHRFYLSVNKKFKLGLMAEVEFQYVDQYFTNDFNGPVPGETGDKNEFINEGYFITDISAGFEKDLKKVSFTIFAGINNLFNNKYSSSIIPNAAGNRFFEPAPGRIYYIGLKMPIQL